MTNKHMKNCSAVLFVSKDVIKKQLHITKQLKLERMMYNEWNSYKFLMGMQNGTNVLENSLILS